MLLHLWVIPLPLYIALLVLGGLMLGSSIAVLVYECLVMPARPAPTPTALTRRRVVFVKRNNVILVLLGNLIFLGKIESQLDMLALTLAVKIT